LSGEWYKWPNRCNSNNCIDLWISSTCFGQSFAHLQERKTVVYNNVTYCPKAVVGWRPGMRRSRLCVRCEGCCSTCSTCPATSLTPNTQSTPPHAAPPTYYNIRTIHHIAVNHSLTLLKMGKILPEICWADSKITFYCCL
jgi:hypothetical protein